jgi:hypothetical protein
VDKELTIGKVYAIGHRRKGDFRAQLVDIVPGDEADPFFLMFKIDTREGSGQEKLARARSAKITVTNLRPSLITRIEEMTDGDDWLCTQHIVEEEQRRRRLEQQPEKRASRIDRIKELIARIGGSN